MRIKLHHVNLCSKDVLAMDEFYRTLLDLRPEPSLGEARVTEKGYAGKVAFLSDGDVQVHLAERDLGIGFRTGQAINPLDHGHIAFRTDDIAAVKRRLEEKRYPLLGLRHLGHERLAPDLLLRPGRQRCGGPSGH